MRPATLGHRLFHRPRRQRAGGLIEKVLGPSRHLDDVRRAKRVDRHLRVAELCEDLVRVLAERRCATSEAARRLGQIHRSRQGWATFIGIPKGKNEFWRLTA